jgi:hypothetical protein
MYIDVVDFPLDVCQGMGFLFRVWLILHTGGCLAFYFQ